MSGDLEFLPPHQFSPFEEPGMLTAGGPGQIFTQGSGQPYDLVEDLPVSSGHTTTRARGGAVHFDNPPQTSTGSRAYPDIDRGFYYTVDGAEVITQSFWGINSDVYFQTLVKSTEASIWGYGPNGTYNFKQKVDSSKAKYYIWSASGNHCDIKVDSSEASVWCGTNAADASIKTDSQNASLNAWTQDTWININTEDLPDSNQKAAKFRKIFDGSMIERYVLCTDPGNSFTIPCADLGDPRVKDIYASNLYSDPACTNNSNTYLSLENSLLQIKEGGGSAFVTIDSQGLSIEDGSDTTYISADETRIQNGSDNSMLDAKGLSVESGSDSTYISADEIKVTDGNDNANLSHKGLWVDWGSTGLTKVLGGSIEIKGSGSAKCTIEPPANELCYFRQAKVCVDGIEKTAYVLMSEPK